MANLNTMLVTVALLATVAGAVPEVLIDTDFTVPGKAFESIIPDKGVHITGALPEGWSENTSWKDGVVARYTPLEQDGERFLRISQSSGDGLQFRHLLPGVEKAGGHYRLTLSARSVTGGSLAVRFDGPPYNTVWSFTPPMDAQWREFTHDFKLDPQDQELGLYFYLSGNGSMDLRRLTLARLSEEDLTNEIKQRYPDAGQGNLVNVSRFPLGLPSGWSIDREFSDGDRVQVESDDAVSGPSGCPALRVTAHTGAWVYSGPFATPWGFDRHTASIHVRGTWDGTLSVIGPKSQLCATIPLKLSESDWQRIELPFKPVLAAPSHSLRLQGGGVLWLDGLQVERGETASPYTPRWPLEVGLALPESDAHTARVQFSDEPSRVSYRVFGEAPGSLLKARLVTLYGDEALLPPVALGDGPLVSGTLTCPVTERHSLGPHRLEAWVEDPSGRQVSATSEIVFYRLRRPRYWGKDAPDSFFGTHTLSTNRHLAMSKAVGCNWVRLHDAGTGYIGWSFLEPEKGNWQFRDEDLRRYRDHHLKILGLLSTSPGWASNWGKPCTGYFERYMQPLSMDDWANAVRTIVTHHRDMIDTYEIWNEPWGASFWSLKYDETRGPNWLARFVPSETSEQDYARLQATAYAAAREVMPGVTIVGINSYGSSRGTQWTRDVMQAGGLETCDVVSYHHYESGLTGMPGDPVENAYAAAIGPILQERGEVQSPVWMSEGAPLSGNPSNGFYNHTVPYENTDDNWRIADRLVRYLISHRATGAAKAFLYTMHGHSTFGGPMDWSTLITADGYLHPSAAAHSACAWFLEDTTFVRRAVLAEGVFANLFGGPERAVAAITTAPSHGAWSLPTAPGVECFDLFGNPVAPGALVDGRVHYVVSPAGLDALRAALGVE